jgi:hypothetical protein
MTNIDFKNKSTIELKAAVYDISALMQQYTTILTSLNDEINRRNQEEAKLQEKVAEVKNPE